MIAAAIEKAQNHQTSWPTGRRLDTSTSKTMEIRGECLGPASSVPDSSTPIGTVAGYRIEAAAEKPNREQPNIWTDAPAWMAEGL